MTQQQSAAVLQLDSRTPERQVLFLAINSLKAADADLAATHRAASDDWDAKMIAEGELSTLRTVAPEMGTEPLLRKIEQAVIAGVEPSVRYFNDEEEKFGARLKSALQDIEFYTRRRVAKEASIPEEERAVIQARRKVKLAALGVIRASGAAAAVASDLATLQAALIEKRVQLHFFISNDLVDDAAALQRLMTLETKGWRWHPAALNWSAALEALMVDADAELPA
jgi:hypothetical protein